MHTDKNRIPAGILMIAALVVLYTGAAEATCSTNDAAGAAAPCFDSNDDILGGQLTLLGYADLLVTDRTPDNIERYTLDTSDLAISSDKFEQFSLTCTVSGVALTQSLVGRVFALPNDVIVSVRSTADCLQLDMLVIDPANSSNNSTTNLAVGTLSNLRYAGIAMADVNLDGYQDIIFITDKEMVVYTAKCNNDPFNSCTSSESPSDGFDKGPVLSLSVAGPFGSRPVTGDFNGDGYVDVAWPAVDSGGFIGAYVTSFCPFAGVEVITTFCSQALQVLSQFTFTHAGGGIGKVDLTGHSVPRPFMALAAGNFDGMVDATTGIASDELLIGVTGATDHSVQVSVYQYNGTKPIFKDTLTDLPDLSYDNNGAVQIFLASAELDSSTLQDYAVFSSTQEGNTHRGYVSAITFNSSSLAMTQKTTVLPNNDKTRIFGMAVGRFDPPDDALGNTDFTQQIAVLVDHDSDDTQVQIFSAAKGSSPSQESQKEITAIRLYSSSFIQLAALTAGDLQGRSLVLGAPEKATVTQQQADVVLQVPPMHVDFIVPPGGSTEQVTNVSVFPKSFNVGFSFDSNSTNQSSSQAGTSYTGAYKESGSLKVSYGVPDLATASTKFSLSATQSHTRAVTKTYDTYQGKSYNMSVLTEFQDQVSSTIKTVNIYTYPVIGQYVCPATASGCPTTCSNDTPPCEPLMVQYSGPDNVTYYDPAGGINLEWYQPVHETGSIFSYPGSLALLQANESTAIQLFISDNWASPSQATETLNITYDSTGTSSKTVSSTDAFSFDGGVSVKLKETDVVSTTEKLSFNANESFSLSTLNTSTQSLGLAAGVTLMRGIGGGGATIPPLALYNGETFVYGLDATPGRIQPILNNNTSSSDLSTYGPFKVGHVANMLDDNNPGKPADWWRQTYQTDADVALNHPQRWTQRLPTSTLNQGVLFNCPIVPIGYTSNYDSPSSDLGSCVATGPVLSTSDQRDNIDNNAFYWMKGLFVTPDTDNGPTITSATLGDVVKLQVRVYNYSLAAIPTGARVHVAFYAQPWDGSSFTTGNENYSFATATKIGPDIVLADGLPKPFCGGSQNGFTCVPANTPQNWVMASTTWDTSTVSFASQYKFWVVVWMEDSTNGGLVSEIPGHGLTAIPTIMGLPLGSLADVAVETYSNNLGFYNGVFKLVAAPTSTAQAPDLSAEERQLVIEQIEIDLDKLAPDRIATVRVHHRALGGRQDGFPAALYDGDPEKGGQLLDIDIVPRIEANELFVVRFRFVPRTCGPHTLFAQSIPADGAARLTESIRFKVPCEPLGVGPFNGTARATGPGGHPAAALHLKGGFRTQRPLDLAAVGAEVTLDRLLEEAVGGGERVGDLPLILVANPANSDHSALYETVPGTHPTARLRVTARPGSVGYSFDLSLQDATIGRPELCPMTDLLTRFLIDDDLSIPPVIIQRESLWECLGRSGTLRTP